MEFVQHQNDSNDCDGQEKEKSQGSDYGLLDYNVIPITILYTST